MQIYHWPGVSDSETVFQQINPVMMELRPVKQSLGVVIRWWRKIHVYCNPNIHGPIQCSVIAPIVAPVVTKYSSPKRAQPYSLYSCYSESKTIDLVRHSYLYLFELSRKFHIIVFVPECSHHYIIILTILAFTGLRRCLGCILFLGAGGNIKG